MVQTDYNIIPKSFYNAQTTELTTPKEVADRVQSGIQAKLATLPPVAAAEFLKQVATLAPSDVDTPAELGAVLDRFETAAKSIQESASTINALVGDISKFLGRAMIEFASQQKQAALDERMAAREAAMAELKQQASAMDAAAQKMMTGAITSAVLGGIGAAVSGIGAAYSFKGQASEIGNMSKATNSTKAANAEIKMVGDSKVDIDVNIKVSAQQTIDVNTKNFQVAQARAQNAATGGQIADSIGQISKSGSAGADGSLQAQAKKDDAEGTRNAADSQYMQQISDQKKEIQESMNDMIKQLINFLKEMKEAEVDAMRSLTKV